MKLNVCKEIASTDLNDKTIASLQPNVSPGRYNLKLQANENHFENCSGSVTLFKNPYRNPFQSSSLLAIRSTAAVLLKCSFIVLSSYFIVHRILWPFPMPKFD